MLGGCRITCYEHQRLNYNLRFTGGRIATIPLTSTACYKRRQTWPQPSLLLSSPLETNEQPSGRGYVQCQMGRAIGARIEGYVTKSTQAYPVPRQATPLTKCPGNEIFSSSQDPAAQSIVIDGRKRQQSEVRTFLQPRLGQSPPRAIH